MCPPRCLQKLGDCKGRVVSDKKSFDTLQPMYSCMKEHVKKKLEKLNKTLVMADRKIAAKLRSDSRNGF